MTFFLKKFREIVLQSILLKKLISRNFCFVKLEFRYLCVPIHTVEITEIYSYWKNISSNHLFSNFFRKTVTFTKFLPKMRESEFP